MPVIPKNYFEKLTAHQNHVINLHQKHYDLSGQISYKDETQLFFICWPMLQLVQKNQNQFFSKQQGMKTKNSSFLKITDAFSSGWWEGTNKSCYSEETRIFQKKNFLAEICIITYNEKCWMTEELMAEWPREV